MRNISEKVKVSFRVFLAIVIVLQGIVGPEMADRVSAATQAESVVNYALSQVGMKERSAGSDNIIYNDWFYGRVVVNTYGGEYSWCHVFIAYCANRCGVSTSVIPKTANCQAGVNWFKSKGRYHTRSSGYTPAVGDIIYLSTDGTSTAHHVGIVYAVDNSYVYYVDGNNTTTNPHGVAKSKRGRNDSRILGYGNPAYTSSQVNTPPAAPTPSINNVGFDSINSDGFTLHCSVDNASLVKINVESLDTHQKLSDSYTSNLQNVSYSFQASSLPSSSRQYTVYIYAYASDGKGGYCNETLHRVMYGPIGNVVVLPIQPMQMYIEEVPMDMVSGGYIAGWIVHTSEIERMVVEMNGKEYPVTNRYLREDVKAVFPQYDASKAGFSLQLDPIGLFHGANYLTIKIFVDGAWVDVYHTDFEIVKLSDLYFDDAYYYARYKQEDEEVRRIGPNRDELLRYYYRNGVTKGHAPCMGWDPKAYLSLNKDLQKAYGSDYREAYAHFVRYCLPMNEMRILSPYLDLKYYKENYEVLSSMNAAELFSHYVLYGSKAGWQASASQEARAFHKLYSPEQYAQRNADIQKVLGNDSNQLWRHFWTYTIANGEKRVTSDDFDFDYVIRTYGLSSSSEAFWWYLNTGYAMDVLTRPHALKKSEAVAATCEEAGHLAYYACTECGKVFRDAAGTNETTLADLVTQAVGHTYNAWTIVKEASAAENGIRQRQCLICGRVETEAIPKTGIQSSDEETEKSKEPQKETEIPEQDSDGEIEEPDQDIESDNPESMPSAPLAGTQLEDSKSNAIYIVTKSGMNGTLEYLSPKNKKAASITIPASVVIDGITYKVTSIGKNAFKNNKSVTRISIGKNVDAIGKNAFYKCKSLKTITIKTTKLTSKSVKSNAFKGISSKAVFKVPKKSVATYKKIIKSRGAGSKVRVRTQ